jgi:hypothetical protein
MPTQPSAPMNMQSGNMMGMNNQLSAQQNLVNKMSTQMGKMQYNTGNALLEIFYLIK